MTALQIEMSSYIELQALGFDLNVKSNGLGQFKLTLLRGDERVCHSFFPRSANISVAEALERFKLNTWGPTSTAYLVAKRMVDVARALTNKNV